MSIRPKSGSSRIQTNRMLEKESWPEKEHLFFKTLSDISTNMFQELCENIGKSFVAILKSSAKGQYELFMRRRYFLGFLELQLRAERAGFKLMARLNKMT